MNDLHQPRTWHFSVTCPKADEVFLVKDCVGGASRWLKMHPAGAGRWTLTHHVSAGHHRFRYFTKEGNTFFNCGDTNLIAQPLSTSRADDAYAQPA